MTQRSEVPIQYNDSMGSSPRKAIVLTALPVEYQAVRAHLENLREFVHDRGTVYEVGDFGDHPSSWEVAIVETGAGNASASFEAERAVQSFAPEVALFVGIAGGLKDAQLGDVIAATKVYGYESGASKAVFEPRPDVGEASYALQQRARAVIRGGKWVDKGVKPGASAFLGPIAAGEKVVKDTRSDVFEFLRRSYGDALGVEMEGRGFMKALHASSNVDAMVIRGVSDRIDRKEESDAEGWQQTASSNAAAFAFQLLGDLTRTSPIQQDQNQSIPKKLGELASQLYPGGPSDRAVWERAGGDFSMLRTGLDGQTAWFQAIKVLEQGGGGTNVSLLIKTMLKDFSGNEQLKALAELKGEWFMKDSE